MSHTVAGSGLQSLSMIFQPGDDRTVLSYEPGLDVVQIDTGQVVTWVRRAELEVFLSAVQSLGTQANGLTR